jgi:ABC-type amino acid transport substrate-binding protein
VKDPRAVDGDEARAELARQLGGEVPEGLSVLSPAELAALAEMVGKAREQQSTALRAAANEALDKVPAILRRPIRRLLSR